MIRSQLIALASILVLCFLGAKFAFAEAVPVEVVQTSEGQWQLLRDGQPYFIKGAGGDASKEALVEAGGNTFRTWGVGEDLGKQLDEAERLGLTVVVGHWLGHPRHGFDYSDIDMVAEQYDRVKRDVLAYKDHPALLLWGIGNEMEGFGDGDDAAVWSHVQALAAMIKDVDPHHPTMTVTAELGGQRVRAVRELCPDVDIMGINSYGGLPSVPKRYRQLRGTKPIVITEFGPPGTWETEMNSFGAPPELTSTQKAQVYREAYTSGCLEFDKMCLGGFAFAWGYKMEATSTWFGMFLPNGDKLAAVDVMTEIWSGQPPANLCPEIRSFGVRGGPVAQVGDAVGVGETVQVGETVEVDLEVIDPEGAPVEAKWVVTGEASEYVTGGDARPAPLELDEILLDTSNEGATLSFPAAGIYRLYLTASDGTGGGAAASVPIKVEGPAGSVKVKLPLAVYAEGEFAPWAPSGWMGTTDALTMDANCTNAPRSGETCLEFVYDEPGMWVGVAWQHPANDWGEKPGGYDLTGAERLTFWARGAEGGEKLDFGVGLLGSDKPYHDTAKVELKGIRLEESWKQYTIDLDGKDLSRIKTPFVWTLGGRGRPVTFYLDDIRFE